MKLYFIAVDTSRRRCPTLTYLKLSKSDFSRNVAYNGLYKTDFLRNSTSVEANILLEDELGGLEVMKNNFL